MCISANVQSKEAVPKAKPQPKCDTPKNSKGTELASLWQPLL